MTTDETAIVKFEYKPNEPIQTLENVEFLLSMGREVLMDLIPKDADLPRLVAEMKAAISENPKIKRCTMHSIARAAGRAAITGLHIGGPMKQADVIPRNIKGVQTACFEARYGGMIMLATKSGQLKAVEGHVVYSEDKFEVGLGTNPTVTHVPKLIGERGTRLAAYTVLTMEGGHKQTTILRADEVKKREKRSQAKHQGRPWQDWTDEMWVKTGIKHALNYAPISSENMALMEAIQADNEVHGIDLQEPKEGEKGSEVLKAAGELPAEAADEAKKALESHNESQE